MSSKGCGFWIGAATQLIVGQPKRTGNMRKSESALQIKAVSEEIETDSALDRELIIGYI